MSMLFISHATILLTWGHRQW